MTHNASFIRKIVYGCAIVLLLFPLFLLGQPATRSTSGDHEQKGQGTGGGKLAQMRASYGLSQAELGEIDPASETMKMATLGLRGVATNILWTKANHYKLTESWDKLSATLNQIAKLQPNYITVWEFQAHNLSYNVSAEFDDYRHRYHWVKKGIEFLIEGTRFNQRNPRLFWNLGWFIGHKIGRSDETDQFRRLFRKDRDFHDSMTNYINMNNARGPDGYPDNWLVAYLWYLKSEAVVEKGVPVTWTRVSENGKGYADKRRSSVVFYSDPSMALLGHADAVTKDFTPGEKTRNAWRRAGKEWERFGTMDIPTSWGHTVRLNTLTQFEEEVESMRAKLEALAPGLREKIRTQRRATLTPEELAAYETKKPYSQMSQDELMAAAQARKKLTVTDLDVAEGAPKNVRAKARYYANRAGEAGVYIIRISAYSTQVNYEYWQTRCEVEQSETTANARALMRLADEKGESGALEEARDLYEKSWDDWAKIFDEYPQLIHDVMAEDLSEVILRYKTVLDQLDEDFPRDFKLKMLLDANAPPTEPPPAGSGSSAAKEPAAKEPVKNAAAATDTPTNSGAKQ